MKLSNTDEEQQLTITISDTGIGIPKQMHEKLFQRFTQADASTTRKFGGTGLGLAITENLVELLNGNIKLASEVGVGTKFTVTIPVEIIEPSTNNVAAVEHTDATIESSQTRNPELGHILVVEDNRVNQMVIRGQLKSHCAKLSIAENGKVALEMMLENQDTYDLILMDCEMPVMDGYEATKAIRAGKVGASYHAIPIIALTAKAFKEDQEKCYSVGMNGFASKPVKVDILLAEIYRLQ